MNFLDILKTPFFLSTLPSPIMYSSVIHAIAMLGYLEPNVSEETCFLIIMHVISERPVFVSEEHSPTMD